MPYAPFLHNIDGADHARAFRVTDAGGANVSVAAGRVRIDQTVTNYATATALGPLANGPHYVYIDNVGAITSNLGGPYPANSIPLARVIVAGGDITTITDDRCLFYEDTGGGAGAPHNLLDGATHPDTVAQAVSAGSLVYGDNTPDWNELAIAVPAANVRNVLGVDNGDTLPSWKTALDGVNPANIAAAAAPGTSLIFSHRDHVHAHPAIAGDLHTAYLLASGARALTGNWDAGAFTITANGFRLNDNENIVFGTGADAFITYNGVNLYIQPRLVGAGDLVLSAGALRLSPLGTIEDSTGATQITVANASPQVLVSNDLRVISRLAVGAAIDAASRARVDVTGVLAGDTRAITVSTTGASITAAGVTLTWFRVLGSLNCVGAFVGGTLRGMEFAPMISSTAAGNVNLSSFDICRVQVRMRILAAGWLRYTDRVAAFAAVTAEANTDKLYADEQYGLLIQNQTISNANANYGATLFYGIKVEETTCIRGNMAGSEAFGAYIHAPSSPGSQVVNWGVVQEGLGDATVPNVATNRFEARTLIGGVIAPVAGAVLELSSTTAALLIPRMTTAQKLAIPAPANGMGVYDNTLNRFEKYEAGGWGAW